MGTIGMTSKFALRAFSGVLATQREHIPTVTAPIRANVGERLESVRNTVINLLLVLLCLKSATVTVYDSRQPRTPVLDLEIHFVTTFS